jgi:hypothetical protein
LPLNEVPELAGDTSSGRSASTNARFSREFLASQNRFNELNKF